MERERLWKEGKENGRRDGETETAGQQEVNYKCTHLLWMFGCYSIYYYVTDFHVSVELHFIYVLLQIARFDSKVR